MQFSRKERLFLVNQYRILQKLSESESEKKEYENLIEALVSGYRIHYHDFFEEFSTVDMPEEDSQYVLDILEMYRGIIFSYMKLMRDKVKISIRPEDIVFPGFDGNDRKESQYLNYTNYFINSLGRYEEINKINKGNFSAGNCTCNKYDRMLSIWRELDSIGRYFMGEERIKELLNA